MFKKLPFRFVDKAEKILLYIPDIKAKKGHRQHYRKKKIYTRWLPKEVLDRFIRAQFIKEISLSSMIKALECNYKSFQSINDIRTAFAIADCFLMYYLNPRTNSREMMHKAIYEVIDNLRSSLIQKQDLPLLGINMDKDDVKIMLNTHAGSWWHRKDFFGVYTNRYWKVLKHLEFTIMTLQDFIRNIKNYRIGSIATGYWWNENKLQKLFENFKIHISDDYVYIVEEMKNYYKSQKLRIYNNPYLGDPINLHTKAISFSSPASKSWELIYWDFLILFSYSDELRMAVDSIFFETGILRMLKNYIDYLTETIEGF